MREQEETLVWDGEMSNSTELWLGKAFNSWLPSRQRIELKIGRGYILVKPGDKIVKDRFGEIHAIHS